MLAFVFVGVCVHHVHGMVALRACEQAHAKSLDKLEWTISLNARWVSFFRYSFLSFSLTYVPCKLELTVQLYVFALPEIASLHV